MSSSSEPSTEDEEEFQRLAELYKMMNQELYQLDEILCAVTCEADEARRERNTALQEIDDQRASTAPGSFMSRLAQRLLTERLDGRSAEELEVGAMIPGHSDDSSGTGMSFAIPKWPSSASSSDATPSSGRAELPRSASDQVGDAVMRELMTYQRYTVTADMASSSGGSAADAASSSGGSVVGTDHGFAPSVEGAISSSGTIPSRSTPSYSYGKPSNPSSVAGVDRAPSTDTRDFSLGSAGEHVETTSSAGDSSVDCWMTATRQQWCGSMGQPFRPSLRTAGAGTPVDVLSKRSGVQNNMRDTADALRSECNEALQTLRAELDSTGARLEVEEAAEAAEAARLSTTGGSVSGAAAAVAAVLGIEPSQAERIIMSTVEKGGPAVKDASEASEGQHTASQEASIADLLGCSKTLQQHTEESIRISLLEAGAALVGEQTESTIKVVRRRLLRQAADLERSMSAALQQQVVEHWQGRNHTTRMFAQQCHASLWNVDWPTPDAGPQALIVDMGFLHFIRWEDNGGLPWDRDPALIVAMASTAALLRVVSWEAYEMCRAGTKKRRLISVEVQCLCKETNILRTLRLSGDFVAQPQPRASGCIVDQTEALRTLDENDRMKSLWRTLCSAVFDFCVMVDLADFRITLAWNDEALFQEPLVGKPLFEFVEQGRGVLEKMSALATTALFHNVPITFIGRSGQVKFRVPCACVIVASESDPSDCMIGARVSRKVSRKLRSIIPSFSDSLRESLAEFKHAERRPATNSQDHGFGPLVGGAPRLPGVSVGDKRRAGGRTHSVSSALSLPSIAEDAHEDGSSGNSNKSQQSSAPGRARSVGLGSSGSSRSRSARKYETSSSSSSAGSWTQPGIVLGSSPISSNHFAFRVAGFLLKSNPAVNPQDVEAVGRLWTRDTWSEFCDQELQPAQAWEEGFRHVAVLLPPKAERYQTLSYVYEQLSKRYGELQWLDATLTDPFNVACACFFNATDAAACAREWPSAAPVAGAAAEEVLRLRGTCVPTVAALESMFPIADVTSRLTERDAVRTRVVFEDVRDALQATAFLSMNSPPAVRGT
mmetsp:Transcript_43123/g.104038  ORF Transcript_43123/g.104038 Transcript_43123/m.104038 type:complete len:1060 (-) Transcript_43123:206-3385(-)